MRTFKTSEKNRTNYNYYTATGEKIEITPDAVGDAWVAKLHAEDDAEVKAHRRMRYYEPVRYNVYLEDESLMECLDFMTDPARDPLEQVIYDFDCQEHEHLPAKLREAIQTLQPQQIDLIRKVYFEKRTCVSIAAEEGVSKVAIHNRLKKIYTSLGKKLKK